MLWAPVPRGVGMPCYKPLSWRGWQHPAPTGSGLRQKWPMASPPTTTASPSPQQWRWPSPHQQELRPAVDAGNLLPAGTPKGPGAFLTWRPRSSAGVGVADPFTPVDNCTLGLQLAAAVPRLVERHSFVVAITRERPTDPNHCASERKQQRSYLKTVTKDTVSGHFTIKPLTGLEPTTHALRKRCSTN